uniref:Molybdenum cofactor sulfurase 3 n=1 Tax=Aegilops tauschii TaxID=37682 RepID=M8B4K6_AEGTA
MHLSLWKPLSHCAAILLSKNHRRRGGGGGGGGGHGGGNGRRDDPASFLRQLRDALDAASEEGALCPPPDAAGAEEDAALNANLSNHALYGGAEPGTAENDIKERILEYLNVPASEYALVFTVSRGSAFKLLAECYPFENNRRLLTMFDHESQSVNWMAQSARAKGAKTRTAWFRWPTLKLCSTELRKEIVGKRKARRRDAAVGLFVFPAQSRVTGAKYSYQWMALAQQNGWHVMLDAGALGPKDMDSLGLSLFRPDFIITSFYRVFGSDPTGFGCLLIKKSVIGSLQGRNGCNASGMVRIVPVFPQYLSDSIDEFDAVETEGLEDDPCTPKDENPVPDVRNGSQLPAFSGVYTSAQVRETFESDPGRDSSSDRDGASTIFEETESISVGEVMRSPAFSEDCSSENSFWVDVGQSPLGSEKSGQFKKGKLGSPLPSSWFTGRKGNKRMSPNLASRISRSPLYDGNVISFDAAVLSVSQDVDCLREDPEEEIYENGRGNHFRQVSEIQEEPEVEEVACQHAMNGDLDHKESAIRRETEGEFRLLGRRDGNSRFAGGRLFGVEEIDGAISMGRRVSFNTEANMIADRLHRASDAAEASGYPFRDDDACISDGYDDAQDWSRREPEIICRHIDHVDMMGLNRTTLRLRYLINWLVTSLLQLKLPGLKDSDGVPLVHIYGPKIKYERGAAVAFNLKQSGGAFINAEFVQKIAEKNGISLGIGFLSHIKIDPNQKQANGALDIPEASFYKNGRRDSKKVTVRVEVVTASLGFLTNFEDVYKMWAFVAKFLDPSFLESERIAIATDQMEAIAAEHMEGQI